MRKGKTLGGNDVRNPDFIAILDECKRLHQIKSHDYADDNNVFSNFEYATRIAEPFSGVHKTFATLMGIKMARLSELLKGKTPKNESLDDSFIDNTNYSAIWGSYSRAQRRKMESLTSEQNQIAYLQAEIALLKLELDGTKKIRSKSKKRKKRVYKYQWSASDGWKRGRYVKAKRRVAKKTGRSRWSRS